MANALHRLTALGQAPLTSEKPRRYRYQATASTRPQPGPPDPVPGDLAGPGGRRRWPGSSLRPA